jgi:hypothetical protein
LIKVGKSGAYSKTMEYEDPFDTKESYGLYIKHVPFTIRPTAKIPIKQTWKDEDGDDVYLSTSVKYEAYDWECVFVYLANDGSANENISAFVNRISGKWLRIHDYYTNTTRDGVFVKEFDTEPRFLRRGDRDLVIFKVTFRVNNPKFEEAF